MVKVTITSKSLNLSKTLEAKKEVYDTKTTTHIVASTKSYNNLLDEYKEQNKPVSRAERVDMFLDREKTEKAVEAFVGEQIVDGELAVLVADFVKNALDGACVYYKPIIRKK